MKKRIYIFGTGEYGHRLLGFLKECTDSEVAGFIKSEAYDGEMCEGIVVISIKQASQISGDYMILIALGNRDTINLIRVKLIDAGVKENRIFDCSGFIRNNLPVERKRCPICGSLISEYLPGQICESELFKNLHIIGAGYRKNMTCPACGSMDRARWLYYVLATQTDIFEEGKTILHFAPEAQIREKLQNIQNQYIPADINPSNGIIKADIKNIPFKDEIFDYVIANHVLEHIDDLKLAMAELKRVMKRSGKLILSFPICRDMDTIEEDKPLSKDERKRLFGQEDHVRLFGNDFKEQIEKHGVHVKTFSPNVFLDNEEISTNGFINDDLILICNKE
ncbi:class I SAM-dependent methyltransferase [Butyrivibrio sp. FC2001]|uniref:class I SAM-dependent methyltransferase n=1 Tax=Butyrivibrio sp. FC2001 TaxID=1280671 RepID=UPI0003F6C393|nr:class I SAM-dependent methyltransferase [Butyrivibrio sp. FC2001]